MACHYHGLLIGVTQRRGNRRKLSNGALDVTEFRLHTPEMRAGGGTRSHVFPHFKERRGIRRDHIFKGGFINTDISVCSQVKELYPVWFLTEKSAPVLRSSP